MANDTLRRLADLIEEEQESLLAKWRLMVRELPAAKHLDVPTLNDHIPDLLDELVVSLKSSRSDETIAEAVKDGSSQEHGSQRVDDAYDIEEVVAEYNILRECIHDLADRNGLVMQGEPFHVLNRVLDGAIGTAVQAFVTQQALEVQRRREDYLAFVAHDLRTPLNVISLAARVLEATLIENKTNTTQVSQMLKALGRNVQYLETLVSKVIEENVSLETETGVHLERRKLDLWPLVEALIHDLNPVAGTSSTRLVNAIPDDLMVYADAELLRRIFQNLIANAIAYTPRGEVVISAHKTPSGAIECSVTDNGKGMPQDQCAAIFTKHHTDPEKEGGLGLGLAIVLTFVEAHGGTVSAESEPGLGTTVRFTLPGKKAK